MKDGNNCCVLGTGDDAKDHPHVSRTTPMDTKRKEIENAPQYQEGAISKSREKRTTALRRNKDTRPL
jgi:hypothetical protein